VETEPGALDLMHGSPLLAEIKTRPVQLAKLGRVGMAALSYLSSTEAAPAGWKAEQLKVIERAKKPVALTRLDVLVPLTRLVEAVPESGTMPKK
jgi:hypothetical protein